MQSVSFGHSPILIQQEETRDGMLRQEFSRLPPTISFFGSDECQLGSRRFNFRYPRLQLSHALHAVRSPCSAQEFKNQHSLRQQTREIEYALAVCCSQGKIWGRRSDFESVCAVAHVEFDFKRGRNQEQ